VPDHSLQEHLKITTAINAGKGFQNNSLFLFTIGPVQSFIIQARKIQDYFMGSFLLSYLTFIAIEKIIENYGPTSIIYPDLYAQPLIDWYIEKELGIPVKNSYSKYITYPTIPNRFVAIIPETESQKIEEIVINIKESIKQEMDKIKREIFEELQIPTGDIQQEKVNLQLSDFPQMYWVAVPWRKDTRDVTISDLCPFFDREYIDKWNSLWNFAEKSGEYKPNIGLLYQILYTTLEKSMGIRKSSREFVQFPDKENLQEIGKKCSLCGERDVIFFVDTKGTKFNWNKNFSANLTEKFRSDNRLNKFFTDGEGLCAICFIKRCLEIYIKEKFQMEETISFPSTAEVASSDFKKEASISAKAEIENYVTEFKRIVKDKFYGIHPLIKNVPDLDGHWFYKENLTTKSINDQFGIEISDNDIDSLIGHLKEIYKKIEARPNPYYAVIALDGDNMGKWLSGENLPEIKFAYNSEVWKSLPEEFKQKLNNISERKILTPAIHSAISKALRNYSIEFVRKIVEEEHTGKLIYSGGDDVLAFVNLKDLFDVMEKLRAAFSGHIKFNNGKIEIDWNNNTGFVEKGNRLFLTMGPNATASMGVVIAHYKTPLKLVLNKVYEAEKEAKNKNKKDKNSFTIILMKRSGEVRKAVLKWRENSLSLLNILREVSLQTNEKKDDFYFSKRFIYNMQEEFKNLKAYNGNFIPHDNIFKYELKRMLERAYNTIENIKDKKEKSRKKKERVNKMLQDLFILFEKLKRNFNYFIDVLLISTFINSEE